MVILSIVCPVFVSSADAGYLSKSKNDFPKGSISAFLGGATYAMDDLNAFIEAANQAAGAALVDPIKGGTEFGFRLDANINRYWVIGFSYTAFQAQTGYGLVAGLQNYAEIDARGNCFELSLGYRNNLGAKVFWGASAGFGRIKADGHLKEYNEGVYYQYQYRGAGWGPAGRVMVEYQLNKSFFLWLEGGARYAETGTVQHNDQYWLGPDGQGMTFSYTGAFIHFGLRISSRLWN